MREKLSPYHYYLAGLDQISPLRTQVLLRPRERESIDGVGQREGGARKFEINGWVGQWKGGAWKCEGGVGVGQWKGEAWKCDGNGGWEIERRGMKV